MYIPTYIHTDTDIRTYTRINTHRHTQTHAHIHEYIYISLTKALKFSNFAHEQWPAMNTYSCIS